MHMFSKQLKSLQFFIQNLLKSKKHTLIKNELTKTYYSKDRESNLKGVNILAGNALLNIFILFFHVKKKFQTN